MANEQRITDIETFAEHFRLRVKRDECNDQIIPGHRGDSQLYFDGPELCLMVLDGPVAEKQRWEEIKANTLWLGDKSMTEKGHNVQDVKIIGIEPGCYRAAIRMAKCRPIKQLTESQRAALAKTAFGSDRTIEEAPR